MDILTADFIKAIQSDPTSLNEDHREKLYTDFAIRALIWLEGQIDSSSESGKMITEYVEIIPKQLQERALDRFDPDWREDESEDADD